MKNIITKLSLAACIAFVTSNSLTAQSLSELGKLLGNSSNTTTADTTATSKSSAGETIESILSKMGNNTNDSTTTTTTTTNNTTTNTTTTTSSNQSGSALSGLLNAIGGNSANGSEDAISSAISNIIGNVIASNTQLTVANLEGTWNYVAPACKFLSEDFLKSAGGEVVASQLSEKIAPYYSKIGINTESFNFKFDAEGAFVMTFNKLPLSGTASQTEENAVFNLEFIKIGTTALATTPAYFEVVGDKMVVLFEIEKFVNLFRSVVNKLGINSLNTVFELVDSYDGILIGFELKKQ